MAFYDKTPGRGRKGSGAKGAGNPQSGGRSYGKSFDKKDDKKGGKGGKFGKGTFESAKGKFNQFKDRAEGGFKRGFDKKRASGPRPSFDKPVKNTFNREDDFTPKYVKYEYENTAPVKDNKPDINVDENILIGRNPIREAIKSGRDIEKILVQKGEISGSAREIVAKARDQKITVQEVEKIRLDAVAPHHQGLIAFVSAYEYHEVDDILELAKSRGEEPFIVMLDGITDPHNLGAIIRSAECAGAHGVIIPSRRSAGLTATAVKASSGAVEHIHVARVTNLVSTIQSLKKQGLWVYAADMDGENYRKVNFSGPVVLVIGAEGEGIGQLVLENCDKKVSIPLKGQIQSLNASVAAGILMFEVMEGR